MIGYLRGQLLHKQPPFLLLDVAGVGYELEAPMTTFYDLPNDDEKVSLFVHLVVRDDAHLLFGFSDQLQRELFRMLIKINRVGPRVALAILSTLSVEEFIACIQHEDVRVLTNVPGIGRKTAERMAIDLRDRVDTLISSDAYNSFAGRTQASKSIDQDAVSALIALGYKAVDANRAVRAVGKESERREDLIRNALRYLTNHTDRK